MNAKRQPAGGGGEQRVPDGRGGPDDAGSQPPWSSTGDEPLDEDTDPMAVPGGRWVERWSGDTPTGTSGPAGLHGFGSVEPTVAPEAGPGGVPDPAPERRTFPDRDESGELPDNPLDWERGLQRGRGLRPET